MKIVHHPAGTVVISSERFIAYWRDAIEHGTDEMSYSDLADLTHETQVGIFDFCWCEEQEQFPYADCPRLGSTTESN